MECCWEWGPRSRSGPSSWSSCGAVGALFLLYLAWQAARDALALWREGRPLEVDGRWAFWKGVAGNLANPLTWTFWLATGTPAMLAAQRSAGPAGLVVFTATSALAFLGLALTLVARDVLPALA